MAQATVSQGAFDEVVRENMEEFDMELDEALADAVAQLKSQGADLSMVDVSGREDRARTRATIKASTDGLREMERAGVWNVPEVQALVLPLRDACKAEGEDGKLARHWLARADGVTAIASFLRVPDSKEAQDLQLLLYSALRAGCRNHDENRDIFGRSISILIKVLSERTGLSGDSCAAPLSSPNEAFLDEGIKGDAMLAAGLALLKVVCVRCEDNKGVAMRSGAAKVILSCLEQDGSVLSEACGALRAITMGDDMRKDFSGAYEHVKTFVKLGAVPLLLEATRRSMDTAQGECNVDAVSMVFLALKQLAANDESVTMIVKGGGLDLIAQALQEFSQSAMICRTAVALIRNISGNDAFKTDLVGNGGLDLMLQAMSAHPEDASLQEHGAAAMAAMALRIISNCDVLMGKSAASILAKAMKKHRASVALQRQCCLAVRNVAARCPHHRMALLDEGLEPLLREAGKHQGCIDEAYAALRDLQCEVRMVTVSADGKSVQGVQQFGDSKPRFSACYEETDSLGQRVAGSVASPAQSGYRL